MSVFASLCKIYNYPNLAKLIQMRDHAKLSLFSYAVLCFKIYEQSSAKLKNVVRNTFVLIFSSP